MPKDLNIIILNINAYADYGGKDMAGSMRMKNLFNPVLERNAATISNLVTLDLLCLEHNDFNRSDTPGVDTLSIGYASLKRPMSVLRFLRKGIRFIRQHKKQGATNIIYNYQYIDVRNVVFLLYAKMRGFKIIFDLVEDLNLLEAKTKKEKMHMATSRIFLRMIPFFADGIFVISSHIMQLTDKLTKKKVPTFMLPVSVNFNNIDREAHSGIVQVNDEAIKIFYGGSFAKKDGLEFLLEAIDILADRNYRFKLILSGRGEPADMERVFAKIRHPEVVDYKGFLSTGAYFSLLNSVDICCMTRNNSAFANAGFPFKLGEFLAAGKVIIASRIGDVEKYITHKESAYLIRPANTTDIVEALTYCFDNLPELRQSMGNRARAIAMANFNSEVSSKYMLEQCIHVSQ